MFCRNNEKISGANSSTEIRKATIRLLRTVILLTQTLDSLPDDIMMTMKLLYYDDGILQTTKLAFSFIKNIASFLLNLFYLPNTV
mgnify:CR=1 FL=1